MLPPLKSTSARGLFFCAFLAAAVVVAACTNSTGYSTSTITEQSTTCPDHHEDVGTRIIWTDFRSEAEIWQEMCGPVVSPTTTAAPTTTSAVTTTTAPTTTAPTTTAAPTTTSAVTTTTSAPITTVVEKSTVCPSSRARAGRTVYWTDGRSEKEIWESDCGGIQSTTTTKPWLERQWHTNRYTDSLTNKEVVSSTRFIGDAYLFFVCPGSNTLEITIWGEEVPVDSSLDRYRRAEITYRIGDRVVEEAIWEMARQEGRYLLTVPRSQRRTVITNFRNRSSDEFIFSASLPRLPDDQVFDLSGFEAAVEPVLEACGW